MDCCEYVLEANTKLKYKYVFLDDECTDKIGLVCDRIIEMSKMGTKKVLDFSNQKNYKKKKMKYLIFLFPICLFSCNPKIEIKYPVGGYPYPATVSEADKEFYFLPIRDSLNRNDSFEYAIKLKYVYSGYNIPNLSIAPAKNDVFRLFLFCSVGGSCFITITQNEIEVKLLKGVKDKNKKIDTLTSLEREHYDLLGRIYPINLNDSIIWRRMYYDSLTKAHPQLLDAHYYKKLFLKFVNESDYKVITLTRRIRIKNAEYISLVNEINNSGFWEYPNFSNCNSNTNDGCSYTLEANTKNKYQFYDLEARSNECTGKIGKVCDRIVKLAKMDTRESFSW